MNGYIFYIGEEVLHKTMIGPMLILARGTIEFLDGKGNMVEEIFYRCRCYDGRTADYTEFELQPRKKNENTILP